MLPRTYNEQVCSIARALEVVGDRWTLLVVRDAFNGVRRFGDFERSLGIPKKVLAERLERLVGEGVFERRRYSERPERHEYVLTEKGLELWKVMLTLTAWGDRHYLPQEGKPRLVIHRGCGGAIDDRFHCERCGAEVERGDIALELGPALVAAGDPERPYPWRLSRRGRAPRSARPRTPSPGSA